MAVRTLCDAELGLVSGGDKAGDFTVSGIQTGAAFIYFGVPTRQDANAYAKDLRQEGYKTRITG
jgi:hypothetical protein